MSDFEPFYQCANGARIYWRDDDGLGATLATVHDVAPVIERNKSLATYNDGYSVDKDKYFRRAASIPVGIQYLWLTKYGVDIYSADPDQKKKVAQMLDDPEWMYLRTAHFRIGSHWRHSI